MSDGTLVVQSTPRGGANPTPEGKGVEPQLYDAFISYRRTRGGRVARWLSVRLERYRASRELLVELPPEIGQRLQGRRRIFLDTRYERSNLNFWDLHIVPALHASRTLVVISTEDAHAKLADGSDNWVAREIDVFLARPDGPERTLVVLGPGGPEDRFPGRLGAVSARWDWVDLRGYRPFYWLIPGRARRVEDAFSKLLAGIFDLPAEVVPLLKGEERRRRNMLRLATTAAACVFLVLVSTAGFTWVRSATEGTRYLAALSSDALRQGRADTAARYALAALDRSAMSFGLAGAKDDALAVLRAVVNHGRLNVTMRFDAPVTALAVLPDGSLIAGADNGRRLLWHPTRPNSQLELGRPSAGVQALEALADSSLLSFDALQAPSAMHVRVTRFAGVPPHAEQEVAQFSRAQVAAIARLGPGRFALALEREENSELRILDTQNFATSQDRIEAFDSAILAVAVAGSSRLVVGQADGFVQLLNTDAPAAPVSLGRHAGRVQAAATLPDGRVMTAGADGALILRDPVSPGSPLEIGRLAGSITRLAVLPDGRVISGGTDGRILLWNPAEPGNPVVLGEHEGPVTAIAILPDGRIASGSEDRSVMIWDSAQPMEQRTVGRHADPTTDLPWMGGVLALAGLPDGRLASGGYDGRIRLWNPAQPFTATDLGQQEGRVVGLVALADGTLASGAALAVLLWQPGRAGEPRELVDHGGGPVALARAGDSYVISAGRDRTLARVRPSREDEVANGHTHLRIVSALAGLPEGAAVIGGEDGDVLLVDNWENQPPEARIQCRHAGPVQAIAVLDRGLVATAGSDGVVQLCSLNTPSPANPLVRPETPILSLVALGPRRLVGGGEDGRVLLWDLDEAPRPVELGRHAAPVQSLALLSDGRIASGDKQGFIMVLTPRIESGAALEARARTALLRHALTPEERARAERQ